MSREESSQLTQQGARLLFYWGASILLMFIAWAQIAPHAGTNPEWWNQDMARAAGIGVLFLVLSAGMLVSQVLTEVSAPILRRLNSDE